MANYLFVWFFIFYFEISSITAERDIKNFKIHYDNLLLRIKDFCYVSFFTILLLKHSDVDRNPGTRKAKSENFSCSHENVNTLLGHGWEKLFLIEAYNSVYKHDFICTSETFLDSSISEVLKGSPEKDI